MSSKNWVNISTELTGLAFLDKRNPQHLKGTRVAKGKGFQLPKISNVLFPQRFMYRYIYFHFYHFHMTTQSSFFMKFPKRLHPNLDKAMTQLACQKCALINYITIIVIFYSEQPVIFNVTHPKTLESKAQSEQRSSIGPAHGRVQSRNILKQQTFSKLLSVLGSPVFRY